MVRKTITLLLFLSRWLQGGHSFVGIGKEFGLPSGKAHTTTTHFALPPPDPKFCRMLESLGLRKIIKPISDLGYFDWVPKGEYRSVGDATTKEILEQIDVRSKPPKLVDLVKLQESLPRQFKAHEPPLIRLNRYPYGQDYVAGLYVAARDRGVHLDSVDFLFGSYTLFFLAMEQVDHAYDEKCIIAKVPGTNAVLITRYKVYEDNLRHFGPQFERMLTGGEDAMEDCIDVQHLQLVKIANAKVLITGQIDAMDEKEIATELKYNLIRNQLKSTFQAIGSGSVQFCIGKCKMWWLKDPDWKPPVLESVKIIPTEKIRNDRRPMQWMGSRIRRNMFWLQKQCKYLGEGEVKELHFLPKEKGQRNAKISIRDSDVTIQELFPKKRVMLELLEGPGEHEEEELSQG